GNPWQEFQLEETAAQVVDGRVEGTNIILTLSQTPSAATGISYYAHVGSTPPWITNDRGVGLLTFYKYPIENLLTTQGTAIDLEVTIENTTNTYQQFRPLTYEVIVHNISAVAATNINLQIPVPLGTAFASATPDTGRYLSWEGSWLIEEIAPYEKAHLQVSVFPLVQNIDIVATAQVMYSDQPDMDAMPANASSPPSEDDEAAATFTPATEDTSREQTDLAVQLTSTTDRHSIYMPIQYHLIVENKGNHSATNVTINLDVDEYFAYTTHGTSLGHYDNWNTLWHIPDLAVGEVAELEFTLFTLSDTQPLHVRACVDTLDQVDFEAANNKAAWTIVPTNQNSSFDHTGTNTPSLNSRLNAYPTLVQNTLYLNVQADAPKTAHWDIYDTSGNRVMRQTLHLETGDNKQEIFCAALPPGVYFFRLEQSAAEPIKFVKM
ncbi:MAG: CARDB domain-containing protein, partial [Bacteroidota bacterium]